MPYCTMQMFDRLGRFTTPQLNPSAIRPRGSEIWVQLQGALCIFKCSGKISEYQGGSIRGMGKSFCIIVPNPYSSTNKLSDFRQVFLVGITDQTYTPPTAVGGQ